MHTTELDFDPYAVWLQVEANGRPLNPYEFLGLDNFETNQTRLRAAIMRKREMLVARRPEADPEVWQALHDELEAAILTLQSTERRAVLDATLRRKGGNAGKSDSASAPAAGTGESLVCRHCQKENPPQRRFCGGCGQSLWEKCPSCSTEVSSNERFCGNCGAEVQGKREERGQELQEKMDEARAFAAAHRYERALALLRSIAAIDDPRFGTIADAALAEIIRVEAGEKRQKDLAAIALAQGEELLAVRSYEGALQVLQSIPEPLRTAKINECLERANSQWKELLSLNGEIRTLIQEKRSNELFPKLERLLSLRPDHSQAQKLATQLRDQLVAAATKRLNEHQYAEALKLLEQIPSFIRNGDAETVQDKALELSALLSELRIAPLALPSTLAVVQKLVKFAPTNQEAARQAEEFKARVATKPEHPRFPASVWAKTPARTRVQLPVDWLGYFTKLTCEDPAGTKTLRDSPGQFYVALGLALQGLGEADIALNLLPSEKSGLLASLPFSFGKKGVEAAWGLDLGESGLKAIRLGKDPKSGSPKLEACEHIPHLHAPSPGDSELDHEEVVAKTLRTFLERAKVEGTRVVASLSGQRVLGRFFSLPPMPAKKVAEAVQFEARHQIPVPLEELTWAHEILGLSAKAAKEHDELPRKTLLIAARLPHVQAQGGFFKSAGITLDELAPDSVALHNAFQFEFGGEESRPFALLDVGFDSTNFLVSSPRNLWFRSFGLGGENFTQALVKHFQLTGEQPEELKRKPAKARRYSLYCATQESLFVQLVGEVERSLSSYSRMTSGDPVFRLYGLGGAFQTHGLLRYLRWGK